MSNQIPLSSELQAAMTEAEEIRTIIERSSMHEWEPRIQALCTHIDEAYEAMTATPEHEAFTERVHELSILLQEVKRLLTE